MKDSLIAVVNKNRTDFSNFYADETAK